jgi:hypothetical protein
MPHHRTHQYLDPERRAVARDVHDDSQAFFLFTALIVAALIGFGLFVSYGF